MISARVAGVPMPLALAQGLVHDEAPGVLHGIDQRAVAVARGGWVCFACTRGSVKVALWPSTS